MAGEPEERRPRTIARNLQEIRERLRTYRM